MYVFPSITVYPWGVNPSSLILSYSTSEKTSSVLVFISTSSEDCSIFLLLIEEILLGVVFLFLDFLD